MKVKNRITNKEEFIYFTDGFDFFEQLIKIRHQQKCKVREYTEITLDGINELSIINSYINSDNKSIRIIDNLLETYYGVYIKFIGEFIPTIKP